MAVLSPQSAPAVASAAAQITAWPAGDTISLGDIGERGVLAIITNTSGGALEFRISDPGTTPAGNPVALAYEATSVANNATLFEVITKHHVDPATGVAKIGASTTNAAFTVRLVRY
jgi:hypothetical protein